MKIMKTNSYPNNIEISKQDQFNWMALDAFARL